MKDRTARCRKTPNNRILLGKHYLPGDLILNVAHCISHYNHPRYHESITNLRPADIYFGRGQIILLEREKIKYQTIKTSACSIAAKPHKVNQQVRQMHLFIRRQDSVFI